MTNKRPAPLSIRLNAREKAMLDKLSAGERPSSYIKRILFSAEALTPANDNMEFAALLAALGHSGIASSLRDLASAVRSGSLPVSQEVEQAILESCAKVNRACEALIRKTGLRV